MELTEAFTVLVLGDGADGQQICALAQQWRGHGLLGEFGIVTPSDVSRPSAGPPVVMTTLVGAEDPVELLRHLSSRRRRVIRIVVLHLLTHSDWRGEDLVDACAAVADLVRRAVPVGSSDFEGNVRLLRINLLVPETDLAPQSASLLQPGWEVNAVVSPEDRPDLDRLNVFVRSDQNLHGHALAAAATLGGLWAGMREAALDVLEVDSTTGSHDLIVVRSHARAVVGDRRATLLADRVLRDIGGQRDGAVHALEWGYTSDRPEEVVESAVRQVLQEADWSLHVRSGAPLQKARVAPRTMLSAWWRFQLELPLTALGVVKAKAGQTIERGTTGALVGYDAGVVARLDPLRPEQAREEALARLGHLAKQVDPERLDRDAESWGQSTPLAWRRLRELVIGLVDGSELPEGFTRQTRGQLDEVVPPTYLTPVPGEGPLRAVDVEGFARLARRQEAAAPARGGASEVTTGKAADTSVTVNGEQAKKETQPSPGTADGPTTSTEPAGDNLKAADSAQSERKLEWIDPDLRRWAEERSKTLTWRLATKTYEYRAFERQRWNAAAEALRSHGEPPGPDQLARRRKLLMAAWVAAPVILLLGVVIALFAAGGDLLGWLREGGWQWTAVVLLLAVGLPLVGGHLYYRALKTYEWCVRTSLHNLRLAAEDYVMARQQERRWELMYRGVLDWNDILAEIVHTPLAADDSEADVAVGLPQGLPASVAIAVPVDEATDPPRDMVADAVESVCQRGWLKHAFDDAVGQSYDNDPARTSGSGDLPADLDLGLREVGPRRALLETIESPARRALATARVREELVAKARAGQVRIPALTVLRTGEYTDGETQDHDEFIRAIVEPSAAFFVDTFADDALVQRRHMIDASVIALPPGIALTTGGGEQRFITTPGSTATRTDISGRLTAGDLRLFPSAPQQAPARMVNSGEFN